MVDQAQALSGIRAVFEKPIGVIKQLSAGSLMALVTAAGLLPLFPAVGAAFGLDPATATWLGSIGTNILANWVQTFFDEARKRPPKDQDELLARLASAIEAGMAESEFRADVDRFLEHVQAVEVAKGALKGREADQAWFLISTYTELVQHRHDFSYAFSQTNDALEVLGYKTDVLLRNIGAIREMIQKSTANVEQQLEEIKALLMPPVLPSPPEPALWPTSLPSTEPYYPLPQRDAQLQGIMSTLRDPKGRRIVAIDGLGGLGKTAMAVEIGRRCLEEGLFQRILGESAKQERLVGEEIEKLEGATLSFDSLLDAIARQLGRWDIPTMKPEEKQTTLQYLLQRTPYLIIADNLETAENARSLVMELQQFGDGSRVIVTTRPQLGLDFVYSLSLEGLDVIDSLVFLREEARSRNRPEILEAPEKKLRKIHEATGGVPLAMKLIVGQASALPLDVVLENLRQAKRESLYRFIYLESWKLLSVEAQKLLIYMGTVVTTCAYRELASVGIADDEETLQEAIKETTRLSLLNPTQVDDQVRYGIHQLTRHFVSSDLPDIWREQGLL